MLQVLPVFQAIGILLAIQYPISILTILLLIILGWYGLRISASSWLMLIIANGIVCANLRIWYKRTTYTLPLKAIQITAHVNTVYKNRLTLTHLYHPHYDLPKQVLVTIPAKQQTELKITAGSTMTGKIYLHAPHANAQPLRLNNQFFAYFSNTPVHGRLWDPVVLTSATAPLLDRLLGQESDIPKAILYNDKSGISHETLSNFSNAGFAHVLAVSGLHIGIIRAIIVYVVKFCLRFTSIHLSRVSPKLIINCCSICAVMIYAWISGLGYSVLRSSIMCCLSLPFRLIDNLSIASFVIMCIFPESVLYPSFQLSCIAVLGLCWTKRYRNIFIQALYLTFLLSFITFPIASFHFKSLALQPFLTNMLLMPYISCIFMPCVFIFSYIPYVGPMIVGYQCLALKWAVSKLAGLSLVYANFFVSGYGLIGYCLTLPFYNTKYRYTCYISWIVLAIMTYVQPIPIAYSNHYGQRFVFDAHARLEYGNANIEQWRTKSTDVIPAGYMLLRDGRLQKFVHQYWFIE